MNRLTLVITMMIIFGACNNTMPDYLQIYDLRCENLINPLGIDTSTPRFSWKLSSEQNGTRQKAYQILVATDSLMLVEGTADLWNSGKIKSPFSVMIPYKGKALQARTNAYWKIGVWDEKAGLPVWSNIANFSIGLQASDRAGVYIGFPIEAGNPESPLLRKQFEINNIVEKTFLYVNSLGFHEVYLNGAKVGIDVMSPSISQFNKRSYEVAYDVSSFIRQGRNDLVIWLGRGWYQPRLPGVVYDGPALKAQLETLKNGKWDMLFASDNSWTCRESGYVGTNAWRGGRFGGERVDAAMLLADFLPATLDAASWNNVQIIEIPEHAVSPQMTEPNRIQDEILPLKISYLEKDTLIVDMGKALTGWVEIKFPQLKEGQEIVLEYFDHFENNRPARQGQIDRYVASGRGDEVFRNKFNYHGFRYIRISNLHDRLSLNDIKGYLIHTDFKDASSFVCSDPEINAIHDMIKYTLQCLSLGGYLVDCPQLERLGYGGDGNASTQTAQTMFDLSPLYTNWMQAWADCIYEDGGMPHTAPSPWSAGGGPYWCGFIITASWATYINYGDSRLIEKYYPVMQQWLKYVQRFTVDGLLEQWETVNYRNWYLGDWATPVGVEQTAKPSIDVVTNSYISICYATMEKIATFLGKKNDAVIYAEKKEQFRKLIHERFFDKAQNSYATGSQIDLIYPMLAQATPESLVQAVTKSLFLETEQKKNGHLAVGLVGIPVLTEWAIQSHSADWMYGMLKKKDYPGYLYMIENGATATWEHWNGDRSHIHNCYNGIGAWFYHAIGGIRPDENYPGYRRVIIDPQVPAGITWAKTSKETPFGKVIVNWEVNHGIITIDLTIPPGCTAMLQLPDHVNEYTLDEKRYRSRKTTSNTVSSGNHIVVYQLNQ